MLFASDGVRAGGADGGCSVQPWSDDFVRLRLARVGQATEVVHGPSLIRVVGAKELVLLIRLSAKILLNLDGYPDATTIGYEPHQILCSFGEFIDFQSDDEVRYRLASLSGMSGGGVVAFHEGHASNATGVHIIHFVHVASIGNSSEKRGLRFTGPKLVDTVGCVCATNSEIVEFVQCP